MPNPINMNNIVWFQMSSDKTVTERRVYTFIDWAGEVGGFNRFVQLVFTFILPFVQVWSLDKHLISRLYKSDHSPYPRGRDKNDKLLFKKAKFALSHRIPVQPREENIIVQWLRAKITSRNRKVNEKDLEEARERLGRELDIEHFVRSIRYFGNAMRLLLSPIERRLLRMQDSAAVIKGSKRTRDSLQDEHNSDIGSD